LLKGKKHAALQSAAGELGRLFSAMWVTWSVGTGQEAQIRSLVADTASAVRQISLALKETNWTTAYLQQE
jgi:hypothetical protein